MRIMGHGLAALTDLAAHACLQNALAGSAEAMAVLKASTQVQNTVLIGASLLSGLYIKDVSGPAPSWRQGLGLN